MRAHRVVTGLAAILLFAVGILIGARLVADSSSSASNDTPPPTSTVEAAAPTATAAPAEDATVDTVSEPAVTSVLDTQSPHETTIRRLVEDVINDANTDILDELFADDYIGHLPASETTWPNLDIASYRELPILLHGAIPDIRVMPEIVVAEGDLLAMRAVLTGTFQSEFYDISPTRAPVEVVFTVIYRFNDEGKIAEEWLEFDTLAFAQQFGRDLLLLED